MRANRRRDTAPELKVRRLLHAAGLRYRVDARPILSMRYRADIIFSKRRIAIFIDGCFWHRCPLHGTLPRSNAEYWGPKLARNVSRDIDVSKALHNAGWTVLRFWEHDDPAGVAAKIVRAWNDAGPAHPA